MKRLVAFDLDGTLAQSKQPLDDRMAGSLATLLEVAMVAIISGGDWPQFRKQVISRLPASARLERLFIMPTTGTKLYRFAADGWAQIYAETFTASEKDRILAALDRSVANAGLGQEKRWGPQIEDRGTQITFSALGQEAPVEIKRDWDPDLVKRTSLRQALSAELPGFSIRIGGTTSVDITRPGVDKAYAIGRLVEHSGVTREGILFLGDAIYPGGNDEPVHAAGIDSIRVRDPSETAAIVDSIVAWSR